jgi:hypothetical protein
VGLRPAPGREPIDGLGCRQGRVPSAKTGRPGMHQRLALGLIAALSLLLAACGAPAADAPPSPQAARSVTTQPSAAPASCPTTRPPDPPFVPPAPYPPEPPSVEGDKVWYGTNELWTWLNADGTWEMARDEHGLFDKSFWWRQGLTGRPRPRRRCGSPAGGWMPPRRRSRFRMPPTASNRPWVRSCCWGWSFRLGAAGSSLATMPAGACALWSW